MIFEAFILPYWKNGFCIPKETVKGLFPQNINGQLQDLPLVKGRPV
jgi:hypothetical protein